MSQTILDVHELRKHYPVGQGWLPGSSRRSVRALDDVTFTLDKGETLAVVGESGCGKSTLGRTILRFVEPTSGNVWLDGHRITEMGGREMRRLRRQMQVVFQDPAASLSPRMRVRDIIAEPLRNYGLVGGRAAIAGRVADLLEQVGLPRDAGERYPHEFSGGQRQRIAIARALAPEPNLLICDEAVSALDVSSKAQIVNLLADLQQRLGLAILFISHDLAVVEHIADRIAVMYLGRIVELADRETLFAAPAHPYTQALLSAVLDPSPVRKRQRIALSGEVPSPIDPPSGCHFHTRCPYAFERCRHEAPALSERSPRQTAACHLERLPAGA
ncbi:peptide/nickel transport system ATP-binding protein [Sphingomonas zeicaulis]|uniref:ABC transporter ATP-binding protein n=1 Tax=Sphingomonas zeicaulis TaxID=1632740 RepID=UPI003D243FFC